MDKEQDTETGKDGREDMDVSEPAEDPQDKLNQLQVT